MKYVTSRIDFVIRILLLMVCCTLFIPQGVEAGKKNVMDASIRVQHMTLAITGITNPVSQLSTLAETRLTAQTSSAKRAHQPAQGSLDDTSSPISDSATQAQPEVALSLCAYLSSRTPLPASRGLLTWFALAPPSFRNI
jgi:hypothetical protein